MATQEELNIHSETGDTPFMSVIRNESVEIVEVLLRAGANPDYSNKGGWFPIHFATQQRDMQIVELLVKYGATIDQQDGQFGTTPLFVAISKTEGRTFY